MPAYAFNAAVQQPLLYLSRPPGGPSKLAQLQFLLKFGRKPSIDREQVRKEYAARHCGKRSSWLTQAPTRTDVPKLLSCCQQHEQSSQVSWASNPPPSVSSQPALTQDKVYEAKWAALSSPAQQLIQVFNMKRSRLWLEFEQRASACTAGQAAQPQQTNGMRQLAPSRRQCCTAMLIWQLLKYGGKPAQYWRETSSVGSIPQQ